MSFNLSLALIVVSVVLFLVIVHLLKCSKIPLKYSLVWMVVSLILFCSAFLPNWLIEITKIFGFQTTSNLIIGLLFVLLFGLCIVLTIVVSSLKSQITLLMQEISILKSKEQEDFKNE